MHFSVSGQSRLLYWELWQSWSTWVFPVRLLYGKRSVGISRHYWLFVLLTSANYSLSLKLFYCWCLSMSGNSWLPVVGVSTYKSQPISFPEAGLHNPSSSEMLTSIYFFQLCSAPKPRDGSHCQVWFHCFWRRRVELPGWGYVEGKYSPQLD